jgi:hypothetical protein
MPLQGTPQENITPAIIEEIDVGVDISSDLPIDESDSASEDIIEQEDQITLMELETEPIAKEREVIDIILPSSPQALQEIIALIKQHPGEKEIRI